MKQATTKANESNGQHDAYERVLQRCRDLEPVTAAVAYPCERTALSGAIEAAEAGLILPILVGPRQKIRQVAEEASLNIDSYPIEDVQESHSAAVRTVELVRAAKAEVLMTAAVKRFIEVGQNVFQEPFGSRAQWFEIFAI